MSSRELMLLLSFIRANNILIHKDINDIIGFPRCDIPRITRATMRGPTAEDALLVEQLELWTTEQ